MNKIRLNTIGEVVPKQSSSGGGDLQIKSVTITENGSKAITPDAEYSGMSKVVVNTDVNTQQGLDFSEIYDAVQANELNQFYKAGIEYAEEIKRNWNQIDTFKSSIFENDKNLVFFPNVIITKSKNYFAQWFMYSSLIGNVFLNSAFTFDKANFYRMFLGTGIQKFDTNIAYAENISYIFYFCINLVSANLPDFSKITEPTAPFSNCFSLQELRFIRWGNYNIQLNQSSFLSPESIHYIIQNAMDVADGATARTLTLHADAKNNWMNSEYYEEDEITRISKGIEIA